jgi:hypothetical protein
MNSNQCNETALENIQLKCIWVEKETESTQCQEIKDECKDISTKTTCEYEGSAGTGKECVWVEEEKLDFQCRGEG